MTDAGSPSGSQPGSGWTPPTGWSGSGDSTEQGTGWGANPTPAAGAGPGSASGPGAMPPGVHPGGHAAGPAWGSAAPAGPAGPSGPQWSGQPASGWGGQAGGWHTSPQWSGGGWGAPQAPKPGVVPLRPLNLGELIDGAFTTIQRYPKIMLGMSAIVMTAVTLLSFLAFSVAGLTSFANATPEEIARMSDAAWLGVFAATIGVLLASWIGGIILTGMITVTVARGVLGQSMTVREAWDGCRPHLPRLLGLSLVLGLTVALAIILLIVVVAFGFAIQVGLGVVLLLAALGVGIWGGIVVWARTAAAVPALVLEIRPPQHPGEAPQRLGIVAALQRSWTLIKGRTGRTFGTLLVASIIAGIVGTVVQTAFSFLSAGVGTGIDEATTADPFSLEYGLLPLAIMSIGYVASAVLQVAFLSGVNALLYVDARMRKEGLDIELAQAAAGHHSGTVWTTR